jgi:hypothetical protein
VVHIFAAVGAESGDDGTARAFSARRTSGCIGTPDGLREFRAHASCSRSDFAERAANADRLIDGGAGASAQTAQYHAARAADVLHRTPARTACALRHPDFVSQIAIAADAGAIEPRRIEELAGLHVESNGNGIFVACGLGSGPAASAASEVDGDALACYADEASVSGITVAILIGLRRGERGERDQTQNRDRKERSGLCRGLLQHTSQKFYGVSRLRAGPLNAG